MSTIRRWRAVRVCGTAGPAACSWSCAWLIVVSFSGSSGLTGRVALIEDAGQRLEEGVHLRVTDGQWRHEPYDIGGGRVHQETGVLSRLLHLGRERLREHDTQQKARTTDIVDHWVAQCLDPAAQLLTL